MKNLWPLIIQSSPSLTASRLHGTAGVGAGLGLGLGEGGALLAAEHRFEVLGGLVVVALVEDDVDGALGQQHGTAVNLFVDDAEAEEAHAPAAVLLGHMGVPDAGVLGDLAQVGLVLGLQLVVEVFLEVLDLKGHALAVDDIAHHVFELEMLVGQLG